MLILHWVRGKLRLIMEDLSDLSAALPSGTAASANGPHRSLAEMLRLADLTRSRVAGDGNCAYYAACASAGPRLLESLGLWALEHVAAGGCGRPSASDLRLQCELRKRVADWLQRDENAEHRRIGTEGEWDEAAGEWRTPPPPSAASVERHRSSGCYAQTPQLRGLAEVLGRTLISIDGGALYDRVPVFTPGERRTVRLRSWRREVAPDLRSKSPPPLVIINNGALDASGHFDGTRRAEVEGKPVAPND